MRRRVAIAGFLALLLGLWWLRPAPAEDPGPSPMASWRARQTGAARPAPSPVGMATPEAEEEPPEPEYVRWTSVTVHLRDADQGFLVFPRHARFEPGEFWPLPGEAPFPAGDTADGLQELIRDGVEPSAPQELAWLDRAWEEGLDPDEIPVDDPWEAVLALEVARRAALADQAVAYREALDAGLGPENGLVTADALVGPPDVAVQLALAEDLARAWPDHPAGEFALLYTLDGIVSGKRSEGGRAAALDILRHTEDALVAGQAIGLLTTLRSGERISGPDLDRLERFATDFPDLVDPIELSAFALDQALAAEDGPRTRAWLDRFTAEVDATCTESDPDLVTAQCLIHQGNRDKVVAYVGDLSPSDARTWQQAFEIAGYHCARLGHDWRVAPIRAEAHWREGWTWEPWDAPAGEYGRCFWEAATSGPEPAEQALDVRVAVVR